MAKRNSTESDYTIPQVLYRERWQEPDYDGKIQAAAVHSKSLKKAELRLSEATDHLAVLEGFLASTEADVAVYAESVVKTVRKLVQKARDNIDRQGTADCNLFVAYHDLRTAADRGEA